MKWSQPTPPPTSIQKSWPSKLATPSITKAFSWNTNASACSTNCAMSRVCSGELLMSFMFKVKSPFAKSQPRADAFAIANEGASTCSERSSWLQRLGSTLHAGHEAAPAPITAVFRKSTPCQHIRFRKRMAAVHRGALPSHARRRLACALHASCGVVGAPSVPMSSGQMWCQSCGRRCQRHTAPPVIRSMSAILVTGTDRSPFFQK